MSTRELTVSRGESGAALAPFLAQRLGLSQRQAKALDRRDVLVNHRPVWMARHALRAGDVVHVALAPPRAPGYAAPRILADRGGFVVADKPPGITSNGPGSLELALRRALDAPELAAAHRLDRDTSGCNLFCRTAAALDAAIELFRNGAVHKRYRAIVAGNAGRAARTLTAPLEGRRAVTRFEVLDARPAASHLAVEIETGRTHQIRKHLAGIGHPVLGDRQYGGARLLPGYGLPPRQMLHAERLSLPEPGSGTVMACEAPLPDDFRRCLTALRLR